MSNTRFLILPEYHLPNLASRAMKLCLARLSEDWQAAWQHPVMLAESFVDPQLFRGTACKVSGWINPGATAGFARHAADYYVAHDRPKQLWVRELVPRARGQLRAEKLPPAWAAVEAAVPPRCRDSTKTLRALTAHLASVPDTRSRHGLRYPLAGRAGAHRRGPVELAAFAAGLSQGQLRALRFQPDPHTRRHAAPSETVFTRVLAAVDNDALQAALLAWQEQLLGPPAPGLFRRLVVSVGHAWLERAQKKKSRASLQTFVTTLRAHGTRRALDLVTTCAPKLGNNLEAAVAKGRARCFCFVRAGSCG